MQVKEYRGVTHRVLTPRPYEEQVEALRKAFGGAGVPELIKTAVEANDRVLVMPIATECSEYRELVEISITALRERGMDFEMEGLDLDDLHPDHSKMIGETGPVMQVELWLANGRPDNARGLLSFIRKGRTLRRITSASLLQLLILTITHPGWFTSLGGGGLITAKLSDSLPNHLPYKRGVWASFGEHEVRVYRSEL